MKLKLSLKLPVAESECRALARDCRDLIATIDPVVGRINAWLKARAEKSIGENLKLRQSYLRALAAELQVRAECCDHEAVTGTAPERESELSRRLFEANCQRQQAEAQWRTGCNESQSRAVGDWEDVPETLNGAITRLGLVAAVFEQHAESGKKRTGRRTRGETR